MATPHPSQVHPAWRRIAFSGMTVLLTVIALQWRSISRMRRDIETLRAQTKALSSKLENLPATPPAPALAEPEGWTRIRQELQQLRDDIRQVKSQTSPAKTDSPLSLGKPAKSQTYVTVTPGENAQLLAAAVQGDTAALDKLATRVAASLQTSPAAGEEPLAEIRSAFDFLGTRAGNGDTSALKALWQASRIPELEGFATAALGQAAALGEEEALRPLLEPETFLLLRASATSALKPAADAGNERAIQALAATAADPARQALWLLATQGLQGAASAGNAIAIESLARIADQANEAVRKEALLALEAAARRNHAQAEEALKRLGWR